MGRSLQLIAFALALACLAATGARAASLQDILYGSKKTSGKVSVAAAEEEYNDYGIETKELCLQENNQRSCGNSVACVGCTDSYFWTSDFQCCREEDYDYGYKRPRNSQLFLPVGGGNAIGSCDWTVWWTNERLDVMGSTISKIGSAIATCYFGPESEECGGPLCDRLAMTLQGTIYHATTAYSYWGASTTENACGGTVPPYDTRTANKGAADTKQPTSGNNAAGAKPPQAELAYDHGMPDANHPVYSGAANIIMGVITSMTGQRKEKWDEGTFEYTAYFGDTTTVTGGIDASALWVRDKAYKLTFYKSPSKY